MSDNKESEERDQIIKNDKEKVTDVIEVLKMEKLSSQKNMENVEKESDGINWIDVSDNKDSD